MRPHPVLLNVPALLLSSLLLFTGTATAGSAADADAPTQRMPDPPQRTVLITGATSGIGAATARRFAAEGWKVIATGRRAERLQPLVEEFGSGVVHPAVFDVRDAQAMEQALATLPEGFRRIDLLVNNAGLARGTEPAQQADLENWRVMIDTNITALATLTHRLLPELIERRGHVINIGSVAGRYPYAGGNVYGGTKAFVEQFSMGLRSDLRGTGTRVTVILPGLVETEFTLVRTGGDRAASARTYGGAGPLTPDDLAESIYWAATLPPHVNVNRIEVMPVSQSFSRLDVLREQ